MSGYECYLYYEQFKLHCRCGYRGYEDVRFVDNYSHCTKSLEEYVARLCDHMGLKEVAELVDLDWKTVKRIDKKYIQQTLTRLCELSPTRIGVDMVAYEKGHKYLTIVRDVDTGHVIWVGEDRKQSTLDMFF